MNHYYISDSMMRMSRDAFNSLQIFAEQRHPNMHSSHASKQGFSLFCKIVFTSNMHIHNLT